MFEGAHARKISFQVFWAWVPRWKIIVIIAGLFDKFLTQSPYSLADTCPA
jgi:hypothetical protein